MNYPMESLAIIAPIIFLVLMIGVPVIGLFAGWKRAAYWGGGTFVFFLIGMIVWKTAGGSIANMLAGLINGLLPEGVTATTKIITSIAAPIFFIGVMAIGELLLLINYYAWFKRVAKIKQDIKVKKEYKAAKKAGKKNPQLPKTGWSSVQLTTKGKIINMACGAGGMALLMTPSTVTFTQAVFYATTSSTTRLSNGFAQKLYASLERTAGAFSWMSYYGKAEAGKDFDSLFSMLQMYNTKTSYTYIDESGVVQEKEGTVADALVDVVKGGFTDVIKKTTTSAETTEKQVENTKASISNFADTWNDLLENNETPITTLFQSENVAEMLKDVIGEQAGSGQQLSEQNIKDFFGSEAYNQVMADYIAGEGVTQLKTVAVSQETFDSVVESIKQVVQTDIKTTETQQLFDKSMAEIVSMMFEVK